MGSEIVKHLTLRLPSGPDYLGSDDESSGLTRLRALTELRSQKRHSIHQIFCLVVENSKHGNYRLPFPKSPSIGAGKSFERLDVRFTQDDLNIIDALRDQMTPRPEILDFRNYYARPDVLRELLKFELKRLEAER